MTFLDMVRELGDLTQHACAPSCSPRLHRMEAAQLLGILIANPKLAWAIAGSAAALEAKTRKET